MFRLFLTLVVTFFVIFAQLVVNAQRTSTSEGGSVVMLIGGHLEDEHHSSIWDDFLTLSGGATERDTVICMVTTAGSDPCCDKDSSFQYYVDILTEIYDMEEDQIVWIPVEDDGKHSANKESVVELLESCTGLFFGGGDQSKIINAWTEEDDHDKRKPTKGLATIQSRNQAGKLIVAGTSAGLASQSPDVAITGGVSYYGIRDGAYDSQSKDPDELTYDPQGGLRILDFFSDVDVGAPVLDSHFSARGREGRLIRLIADTMRDGKGNWGLGVDENTMIRMESSSSSGVVVGEGGVWYFSLANATVASSSSGKEWSITNIRASYFTDGDSILFHKSGSFEVKPDSGKTKNLKGKEEHEHAESSKDIFNSPDRSDNRPPPQEFVFVTKSLMNSKDTSVRSTSYESNPTYDVTLVKDEHTEAWIDPDDSDLDRPTIIDLVIDIVPAEN